MIFHEKHATNRQAKQLLDKLFIKIQVFQLINFDNIDLAFPPKTKQTNYCLPRLVTLAYFLTTCLVIPLSLKKLLHQALIQNLKNGSEFKQYQRYIIFASWTLQQMDKKSILACNIIVIIVSIIQIIAGSTAIKLGNDLSSNKSLIYSSVYTTQANYYIAAGVLSLLMSGYSIFVDLNLKVSPILANSAFLNSVLVLCFQFSMAIYSSITANVMSDEAGSFSTFPNSQCSCVTLNNFMIAVAVITWLLSCPALIIQLDWRWENWKDLVVETEQTSSSQQPPVIAYNVSSNVRQSLR